MKIFKLFQVLTGAVLLFTLQTQAAGQTSARYVCDGGSSADFISLIQYQENGRLGAMIVVKDGQAKTVKVMGLNDFPLSSPRGDKLYGAPPQDQLNIKLIREVDASGHFGIEFSEGSSGALQQLECRMI